MHFYKENKFEKRNGSELLTNGLSELPKAQYRKFPKYSDTPKKLL